MELHKNHKIVKIEDEDALAKENIAIDLSTKDFDNNIEKLTNLKKQIEEEMEKLIKLMKKLIMKLLNHMK